MALIPSALITEARDAHPDFSAERNPTRTLLRRLRNSSRRIVRKAIEMCSDPSVLGTTVNYDAATIATAFSDTDGVITVPAYITPIHARAYWNPNAATGDGESAVELVGEHDRLTGGSYFPSVQVLETGIKLTDLRDLNYDNHGWEDILSFDWTYVADPDLDDPADLDSSIDAALVGVPDSMEGALIADLCLFMAGRSGVKDMTFRSDLKDELNQWVYTLQQKGAQTPWRVGPMPTSRGPFPIPGLS